MGKNITREFDVLIYFPPVILGKREKDLFGNSPLMPVAKLTSQSNLTKTKKMSNVFGVVSIS